MNRIKIGKIVGYIESQCEFPFDTFDVEDSFQSVLNYFCIPAVLDADEEAVVRKELYRLASAAQTAEMVRLALRSSEPSFVESLPERKRSRTVPSIRFIDWMKAFPQEIRDSFFSSFSRCAAP